MSDEHPEVDESLGPVPVLAVVGRPNVGKSTLVNRIIGRREAVVEDVPGVTRDRISYDANWSGRAFTVVDTGGWDPDARGLAERIRAQAEIAVGLADAVLFVVDATVGITDADESVVKILRSSKKPVVLAANKVDDARTEAEAHGLWNLGLGEPYAVSALHGRGSGDLLDAVLAALPEPPPERETAVGGPRRVAIVGKPNVGKSSLLNRLAGEERAVVDNVAGTTVDPVDELVELGGRTWRFIDTAGIRKRVKEASGHEYYASLRTSTAIDRAEVAVLVIDGGQAISEQDVRILQTVREAGRALVIAFNKWDLVDEERRYYLEREVERDLVQVRWAPRINVTARTGWHVDRLVPALDAALDGWETRISTGCAQLLPRPTRRGAPAPGPWRQAAEGAVRHPGRHRPADVRAVHERQARGVVRALHRAAAARGVRVRGHADRAAAAASGEAEALASGHAHPDRRPARPRAGRVRRCHGGRPRTRRAADPGEGRRRVRRRSRPTTTGTPTCPGCRVIPRSRQWLRPDVADVQACTPTSVRRTATGRTTACRHGRGQRPSQGAGPLRLRLGERPGALPVRPGHQDRGRPGLGRRQARDRGRHGACRLYETWNTRVRDNRWRAGSGATWFLDSNDLRPDGWTSADAAGLPILPGLLRWREVRNRNVDHAIRFTTDVTSRWHVWPARHDAGLPT